MGIWGWVQAIATGWMTLSILLAVAWALGGRKIFRPRPQQTITIEVPRADDTVNDVINELRRRDRINGGA